MRRGSAGRKQCDRAARLSYKNSAVLHTILAATRPGLKLDAQICDFQRLLKTGKSSLTISANPVGVGAVSQPSLLRGKPSGLLTRIAATESVSLCTRMKS